MSKLKSYQSELLKIIDNTPSETKNYSFDEYNKNSSIEAGWYQYSFKGQYWQYVNSVIYNRAWANIYEGRREIESWYLLSPEYDDRASSWSINISESFRKNQLVSISIGHVYYMGGASHPNHMLSTINLLGEKYGHVEVEYLFDYSDENLKKLEEIIINNLSENYGNEAKNFDFRYYLEMKGWDLLKAFSFRDSGIDFIFSPTVGLPHVLGFFEAILDWSTISHLINRQAKKYLIEAGVLKSY